MITTYRLIVIINFAMYSILTAQENRASITVDFNDVLGNVNPMIFGNNVLAYQKGMFRSAAPEYWDRGAGIWDPDANCTVPEMVALAKIAGINVVRYPGALNYYDWKKTIGPVSERPNQKFGLPEFLQFCSEIKAIPLITIPAFFGTSQDAADLVEYLDAPADEKHPWAMLRMKDGHSKPWKIKWFEFGNEVDQTKDIKRLQSDEYAQKYLEYQKLMKSVDTLINLGLIVETNFSDLEDWLHPVISIVGKNVDFVIHHSYIPSYNRNDNIPASDDLFKISLASESQIQFHYNQMNEKLLNLTGKHIPIAVTEYNGLFVQEKPIPYRHTLGNALLNAKMIKVFLAPQNNILMANSWEFFNEYWGAIKGYKYKNETILKRPLFYMFQLYHEHLGKQLIKANVKCDSYETDGGYNVMAAKGNGQEFRLLSDSIELSTNWHFLPGINISQRIENDNLIVEFTGKDENYYHAEKLFRADATFGYRGSAWIRTEGLTSGQGVCIELLDARGWNATRSANTSRDLIGTNAWQKVQVDYIPLADTKEIIFRARRIGGSGPIEGWAYFRDISVQKFIPQIFPSVPYLSVNASRTIVSGKDNILKKDMVYLMIVNSNLTTTISTQINLIGLVPNKAKAWFLKGPSVDATNEENSDNVKISEYDYGKVKNGFTVEFPPHSLTTLEIE